MVNTGRNLNLISAGIIVYLLSGADFQAIGVSGLSWDIEYPHVVKFAAELFWIWMVIAHGIADRQGVYYRACIAQSADKTLPGTPRGTTADEMAAAKKQLESALSFYGIPLIEQRQQSRFALAYVDKRGYRPVVYVC